MRLQVATERCGRRTDDDYGLYASGIDARFGRFEQSFHHHDGDVDKDFATLMMLHKRVGKRIDQIEAKCGKDAKMQAMAAKGVDTAQQRMDEFRNVGTSQ